MPRIFLVSWKVLNFSNVYPKWYWPIFYSGKCHFQVSIHIQCNIVGVWHGVMAIRWMAMWQCLPPWQMAICTYLHTMCRIIFIFLFIFYQLAKFSSQFIFVRRHNNKVNDVKILFFLSWIYHSEPANWSSGQQTASQSNNITLIISSLFLGNNYWW